MITLAFLYFFFNFHLVVLLWVRNRAKHTILAKPWRAIIDDFFFLIAVIILHLYKDNAITVVRLTEHYYNTRHNTNIRDVIPSRPYYYIFLFAMLKRTFTRSYYRRSPRSLHSRKRAGSRCVTQ